MLRMRLKLKIAVCGGCLVDLMAPLKVLVGKKCFLSLFQDHASCFKFSAYQPHPILFWWKKGIYVQSRLWNKLCKIYLIHITFTIPAKQVPVRLVNNELLITCTSQVFLKLVKFISHEYRLNAYILLLISACCVSLSRYNCIL